MMYVIELLNERTRPVKASHENEYGDQHADSYVQAQSCPISRFRRQTGQALPRRYYIDARCFRAHQSRRREQHHRHDQRRNEQQRPRAIHSRLRINHAQQAINNKRHNRREHKPHQRSDAERPHKEVARHVQQQNRNQNRDKEQTPHDPHQTLIDPTSTEEPVQDANAYSWYTRRAC